MGMNQQLNYKIINLVKEKMDSQVATKEQEKRTMLRLKLLSLSIAKSNTNKNINGNDPNKSSSDISK